MFHQFRQRVTGWFSQPAPDALYDRQLVWLAFALMITGLVMVTSASFPISSRLTDQPFHFMFRHAIFLVLALGTSSIVLQVPTENGFVTVLICLRCRYFFWLSYWPSGSRLMVLRAGSLLGSLTYSQLRSLNCHCSFSCRAIWFASKMR